MMNEVAGDEPNTYWQESGTKPGWLTKAPLDISKATSGLPFPPLGRVHTL